MLPAERVFGAIRAGARYIRYTPAMRSVVIRAFIFAIGASAMWATLPLVARVELHLDATRYGILVTFFGIGAALGGGALSRARQRLSSDALAISGAILFAAVNAAIAWTHDIHVMWLALFVAGAAWVSTTTMYHSSAQLALASWVRARALFGVLTLPAGRSRARQRPVGLPCLARWYPQRARLYGVVHTGGGQPDNGAALVTKSGERLSNR